MLTVCPCSRMGVVVLTENYICSQLSSTWGSAQLFARLCRTASETIKCGRNMLIYIFLDDRIEQNKLYYSWRKLLVESYIQQIQQECQMCSSWGRIYSSSGKMSVKLGKSTVQVAKCQIKRKKQQFIWDNIQLK